MAHLSLVLIHPFRDGNGRMARCLKRWCSPGRNRLPVFSSIGNTWAVIHSLTTTSSRRSNRLLAAANDTRPWIRFVLTAHLRQAKRFCVGPKIEAVYLELERLVARYRLPERALEALFDATSGLRVRRAVYRAILENQSDDAVGGEQTATRDLQSLTSHGLLVAHGERGRYYTAGPELAAIRDRVIRTATPRRLGPICRQDLGFSFKNPVERDSGLPAPDGASAPAQTAPIHRISADIRRCDRESASADTFRKPAAFAQVHS